MDAKYMVRIKFFIVLWSDLMLLFLGLSVQVWFGSWSVPWRRQGEEWTTFHRRQTNSRLQQGGSKRYRLEWSWSPIYRWSDRNLHNQRKVCFFCTDIYNVHAKIDVFTSEPKLIWRPVPRKLSLQHPRKTLQCIYAVLITMNTNPLRTSCVYFKFDIFGLTI